jgi:hypothetical protein
MVQEVKRSASAGGGSDTVSNALASGVAQASGAPSLVGQLITGMRNLGMGKRDQALTELLSNPSELAKELEKWIRPPQPSPAASLFHRGAPAIAGDQ